MEWGKLPAQCEALGAQAVFWTRTWPQEMSVVEPVLKELEAEGIPTVSYHLDRWHGLNREHQVRDQPFFRTSLVVSPNDDPRWADDGVNHFWLPPGVYGPECEPVPANPRRWPFDVVFVGSHPYPHPEWAKYRGDLLATFQRAFRGRFGILPRRGVPVRGRDLQELYATVPVILGDSCLAGESYGYWSDRVPETLGRGGLLIHPYVPGIGAGFRDWYGAGRRTELDDLLAYRLGEFDDAVAAARSALANPDASRSIAEHGRATVLTRDTYAHRMATVLAVAEGIYGGYRDVAPRPKVLDLMANLEASLAAVRAERGPLRPSRGLPVAPPVAPHPYRWPALIAAGGPDGRPCTECGLADYHPIHEVAARPIQRRVQLGRLSARFDLRSDVPTDGEVLDEVWVRNDYRVSQRFSGTVVDIGANIGAFAVLAAKNGAKRVVAFEPEAGNYERLVHHANLNHVADQVAGQMAAVSSRSDGSGVMVGEGGGARWEFRDGIDGIPCVTLTDVLAQWGPLEFVKIDVEGSEYAILDAIPVQRLVEVRGMAIEFHGPSMPHLAHLDDGHLQRWGAMVAKLADAGRVEIFGHPMRGGLIWWQRY